MGVSKLFILGGEAVFTIAIPEAHRVLTKEDHYTYKVNRVEKSERFDEAWFVYTLNGDTYAYTGKLDPFTGQVKRTARSAFPETSYRFRLLNRLLARIWCDDHYSYEQYGFETLHSGRCSRCGRVLTAVESLKSGVGPECARIVATEVA